MSAVGGTYFDRSNGPFASPAGNRGSGVGGFFDVSNTGGSVASAAPVLLTWATMGALGCSDVSAPANPWYRLSKLQFSS